jgi:NitT/TauT family transport system substrate-binding protein
VNTNSSPIVSKVHFPIWLELRLIKWGFEIIRKRLSRVFIFCIAISLLFIAVSCVNKPTGKVYRIGLGPWVGFGPLYLAKEKGFFKDSGVDVDLIILTGLAERNSSLKSGQIDGLAAPVDYFVLSAGNHLETDIAMAIDESSGGDGIVAKKSIEKFEDLRGKRVAFQRGLPSEFFLRALLDQHGVRLDELQSIDMETAQAGAAFIANQVDAAVVWEPWLTKAREEGGGYILASTKEYPNLIVDCLAFNKAVVSRSSEDVQKIVSAILKAIDYWKEHPDEANAIMAPHFEVDAAKYGDILTGLKFCDLARNRQYFGTDATPGPIFDVAKRASQIWLEAKVIEVPVKPESIISTNFVK